MDRRFLDRPKITPPPSESGIALFPDVDASHPSRMVRYLRKLLAASVTGDTAWPQRWLVATRDGRQSKIGERVRRVTDDGGVNSDPPVRAGSSSVLIDGLE